MHELSIAAALVDLAQEEAQSRGVRVLAVHLKLGPLSGVVREALETCFDVAAAGTSLEGSRLVVTDVPIVVFCSECSERRTIPSPQLLQCPRCGMPASEVLEGRELQVTALEIES